MNYVEYKGKTVKIMCCSLCNTKCSHCYINYSGNISPNELYKIVSSLIKKYEVKINGTEPLLNKKYLDSFKLSNEDIILTNGLVFKNNIDYVDDIISSGIKRICISYHFSLHEFISKVDKNYLDSIIPLIRKKGIDVELMCTISSINYDKILEFCDKAVELGANYIYFIEYMTKNDSDDRKFLLTKEMRNKFFELLNAARCKYDKKVLNVTRCGNFGLNPYSDNKNFCCPAYNNLVVMTPDFKIYPCNFLISNENEIGYYEDGKIFIRDDINFDGNNCMYCEKNKNNLK